VERLEQARLRGGQFVQRALHDRSLVAPLRAVLFFGESIGIVVAHLLHGLVSPMVAEQPTGDARQPRSRAVGKTVPLPVVDSTQPRLLRDVLGELTIAAATPDDEVDFRRPLAHGVSPVH